MIVLDTNVLSEIIRSEPNETVAAWFDRQLRDETFVTAISRAEMMTGVQLLAEGKRRTALGRLIEALFESQFENAVLAFDSEAAGHYAQIVAARTRAGRPIGIMDAQIAAIALARGATVATRDVNGFADTGVELIDPWIA